jgi:hypothetical protein
MPIIVTDDTHYKGVGGIDKRNFNSGSKRVRIDYNPRILGDAQL